MDLRVSRTVVKSAPELREQLESELRMQAQGVEVELAEKGFGTEVALSVGAGHGFSEGDLERLLDQLAEPQKRPFSAS